jgi:hypothetical protein
VAKTLKKVAAIFPNTLVGRALVNYCSLVDKRWRDFIHCIKVVSK